MIPLPRASALVAALAVASVAYTQPPLPPPDKPPAAAKADDPAAKPEPGVEVLDRGPIHEAFAQPGADVVGGKGMTAPKAPPPPVPELPPDTKPDGANVKWVSGYWMWDKDRNDFIWISGFWRNTPAGREWQAGEWKKGTGGEFAYTPGFWRPVDMNSWRIDLPEPPRSVENGPSTPPDDPNAVWVPGAWEYRNEQYVWRPGYWARPNGDQLWQPPQYRATPSGFSYTPGYWDYPLEDRGLLYAPVAFTQPLWRTPGWGYRPRFALGLGFGYGGYGGYGYGGLFGSLFIGPGCNNYYYGNYGYGPGAYGGTWLGIGNPLWSLAFGFGGYGGYSPWYGGYRGYYNPLWNHYCWLNRGNPGYAKNVQNVYVGRALGAQNPGAARVAASPRPGVAGAVNTGVRAATATASRPAVAAQSAPLVQPAAQVARSQSIANASRPVNLGNGSPARPAVGNSGSTITTRPAPNPDVGNGITIAPNRPTVQPAAPVHAGATIGNTRPPTANSGVVSSQPAGQSNSGPAGTGITVTPRNTTPASPVTLTPGSRIGSPERPAIGNVTPTSPPVIRSGSLPGNSGIARPAPSGASAPVVRPSAPSLPSISRPSAPSISRPSAPSISRPSAPSISRPSAPSISRPSASPRIGGGNSGSVPRGGGSGPKGGKR